MKNLQENNDQQQSQDGPQQSNPDQLEENINFKDDNKFGQDDDKQRLLTGESQKSNKQLKDQMDNEGNSEPNNNNTQDLRKSSLRWCMLFMACIFMFGNTFCYDNPGPIEKQLEEQFHMDSFHYSLLYTVYSLPNTVLPLFGGILLDTIGIRTGLVLFCTILTIGQFVFMMGGYQQNYDELIAGRVIYGVGGESMGVAQSSIVSVWFKGKELAFALGLNLSISRLGSVVNGIVVPTAYQNYGLGPALMIGFFICLLSLACGVGIAILDKRAEKYSGLKAKIGDKFQWSDLAQFQLSFWILAGSCVITYMSIFPYIQIASDLLQTKYHFSTIQAGYLFGVPYIISAIASPLLGLGIDKFGKRAFLTCLASFILIIGFTSSMMMPECYQCYYELYPLILTGIGYSIYASAIWGCVPYVVKPNLVGTAFGLATSIQNIGLCISPLIVGIIKDKTKKNDHGYFWVNAFFVALNCIGLCLNFSQYYLDIYYNNGVLDKVDKGDENSSQNDTNLPEEKQRG